MGGVVKARDAVLRRGPRARKWLVVLARLPRYKTLAFVVTAALASMSWTILAIACAVVAVLSWVATWAVLRSLICFEAYDRPNARSSHDLAAAADGAWAAALILPLYYLADATITLIRRGARGAKVWQAHREHFYQRAVQGGASHARVAAQVLACNAVLIVLAVVAARGLVWLALLVSAGAVAVLLARLGRR